MKIKSGAARKCKRIASPPGLALALTVLCVASGCGGGQAATPQPPPSSPPPNGSAITVSVSPKTVNNLPAGGTQDFTATVSGTSNKAVDWSVPQGPGCGSISSEGTYSAPNRPGLTCQVMATSQVDSKRNDEATITISPISMYIQPFQISLGMGQMQAFTAVVQGTSDVSVTWSIKEGASGGTITDQGLYTTPQTLGTFHVLATSEADPRFTASAEVDVAPVAVSISPPADTLGPLGTRTFTASVVGTNQQVTWSVEESAAGGSITGSGVYTAPQGPGTFHVVATSLADTTATASAVVTLVASGFTPGNPMSQRRTGHTATLLSDGTVLVAGGTNDAGCLSSAEIFDPVTNVFSDLVGMNDRRTGHSTTQLVDGKVLIAGGFNCAISGLNRLASAELYDPMSASFVLTGAMSTARSAHTATRLSNGKVLITGGADDISGSPLASAELYDPSTGTFTPTGNMLRARTSHSATLLPGGKVLIAGGYTQACDGCINLPDGTAELYDPTTGLFTRTGDMPEPNGNHVAAPLPSGVVLITGGDPCGLNGAGAGSECASEDGTNQAILYDPAKGSFSVTGSMAYSRIGHSATVLPDGRVLITGGFGADPATFDDVPIFAAEIYNPGTGTFIRTGSMAFARNGHTATLISNQRVLVTGGTSSEELTLSSTEIYK